MQSIHESVTRALGSVPTKTGVYPFIDEQGVQRFYAVALDEHGRISSTMITREQHDAQAHLDWLHDHSLRFWAEKVLWKNQGDKTGDRPARDCIRVDGHHYVVGHEGVRLDRRPLGFGGRVWRWRWLDEPEGTVHVTNSMWSQGTIPAEMSEVLPDNAVFLTEEEADR